MAKARSSAKQSRAQVQQSNGSGSSHALSSKLARYLNPETSWNKVYGFLWIVLVVMVLLFKLFTATPKKSTALLTFVRYLQGVLAIGIIAGIALLIVLTSFTVADLFASALAFIATGWCVLCLAVAWKRVVKALGLWDSVREIARIYDAGMGAIIFVPIVFFSWFPFVSTFQSRFLFNQAFSRGLEISLILAAANSMISCSMSTNWRFEMDCIYSCELDL
ncbi:callose synthase 10-like [Miscanthus floridulus]|uniref:callose synthase 10-like n=1 Tax=Miscanthus floridulus TaxID=154761 RepID=UPI00345AEA09